MVATYMTESRRMKIRPDLNCRQRPGWTAGTYVTEVASGLFQQFRLLVKIANSSGDIIIE